MRTLTPPEHDALLELERRGPSASCGPHCLRLPEVIGQTVGIALENRGATRRTECEVDDYSAHVDITPLGRLALRLASAARLEVA
jgi:hypothetical protein